MAAGSHCTTAPKRMARSCRRDERREDVGQKEDGGVQERHHAKAWRRLSNQIAWQPLRARALTPMRGVLRRDEEELGRRSLSSSRADCTSARKHLAFGRPVDEDRDQRGRDLGVGYVNSMGTDKHVCAVRATDGGAGAPCFEAEQQCPGFGHAWRFDVSQHLRK